MSVSTRWVDIFAGSFGRPDRQDRIGCVSTTFHTISVVENMETLTRWSLYMKLKLRPTNWYSASKNERQRRIRTARSPEQSRKPSGPTPT